MLRVLALTAALIVAGCAQTHRAPATAPPTEDRMPVVHVTGFGDVKFGLTRNALAEHLNQDLPGCNTQLAAYPEGSLVFTAEGRLVLLWFEAPLRTPAGIHTGTPLKEVKAKHPDAREMSAPEGSYQFDGLLVASGEHGYLFLHDGRTVQKAIAGYVEYLERLFNTGFGVC